MARVVRFHQTGGPEVLRLEDVEVRPPGDREVRIRVQAIGLNRAEILFRTGQYLDAPKLPATLGYEAAGVVESCGAGVEHVAVGDAVSVIPAFSLNDYGTYGELVVMPANAVVRTPAGLSPEQAAALWMQYLTAYGALVEIGGVRTGDFVIVPAASSSVGIAALQIVAMLGATSIATTRTGAKREALKDLGAAHVIATEEQDLVAEVKQITGGRGARLVFDPIAGPFVETLAAATARGGTIIEYGVLSLQPTPFPLFLVLGRGLTMRGYTLFEVTGNRSRLEQGQAFVEEGLRTGALRPIIARTFPLDRIADAHRFMEEGTQIGKIVVTV